ncbi:MAG: hypothetical protein ACO4CZ_13400 [Planctomycetota bacterium]
MSFLVRLLHPRDAEGLAAACRTLGIHAADELRVGAASVSVRETVTRRPARTGAASVLIVPATARDVVGVAEAAVGLSESLVRAGVRTVPVLPRTACAQEPPGGSTAGAFGELDGGPTDASTEGELALDLGVLDPATVGAWRAAAARRAIEPRLAQDSSGGWALVGGGLGVVVGASLLGAQIARRCADCVLVPCGPGPLGVHHAVEVRGRRLGSLPAAVVVRTASEHLPPAGLRAIRAARVQGLEVGVWIEGKAGSPATEDARAAGASLVCGGRSARAALAEWIRSVHAVDARSGCFLGARRTSPEARVRAVVERVLGSRIADLAPVFPGTRAVSGDLVFEAWDLEDEAPLVAVADVRWHGTMGVTVVSLRPGRVHEG